jgi:hypothetical protein
LVLFSLSICLSSDNKNAVTNTKSALRASYITRLWVALTVLSFLFVAVCFVTLTNLTLVKRFNLRELLDGCR